MLEMREKKIEKIFILDDPSFYIIAYYSAIIDPTIKCLTNLESPWIGLQGFGVIWAPEAAYLEHWALEVPQKSFTVNFYCISDYGL